ncbi:MAG: hypothetical protein E6I09_09870 [Chloroflexi bacterium]|nr:MAG: hypothetical protein E6I09_09870 [Chloroflexota bacterium]
MTNREPTPSLRSRLCERTSLQDETLIAAAQQGDAAAFEELVRRHQEGAFRAAFLVLRDADEAEDAAQDVSLCAIGRCRTAWTRQSLTASVPA